jgi:pilus assembly protein Flp/PilA
MHSFLGFIKDETGATAIEYALIASAMGLALVAVMPVLATAISDKFSSLSTAITNGG